MRCNLMAWVVCIVAGVGLSGCYEDIDIENLCHLADPECAELDWDGDGIANAVDDFPADGACSVRDDDNCTGCGEGCGEREMCDEGGVCVCSPAYTGPDCDFRIIPAGTFTMGSPDSEPCRSDNATEHQVTLTGSFSLKTTEVTQGEWSVLMGNNPSGKSPGCDDCPVETVNWYEALAYCNALSASEGLPLCYTECSGTPGDGGYSCSGPGLNSDDGTPYGCVGYRLPTEAEWEYSARAGTTTSTYNGDITSSNCDDPSPVLEPIAWYAGNSGSTTHVVAEKEANPWGLYDMLGNVWEWVWDWKATYPGDVTDPVGGTTASYRVYRGCSWLDSARRCRAAGRLDYERVYRLVNLGFRPARSLP